MKLADLQPHSNQVTFWFLYVQFKQHSLTTPAQYTLFFLFVQQDWEFLAGYCSHQVVVLTVLWIQSHMVQWRLNAVEGDLSFIAAAADKKI